MNQQELQGALEAILFAAGDPLPVKRITRDPVLLQKTYDLGRRTAEKRLSELKYFFGRDRQS